MTELFDPTAPLPSAPDPWASTSMPSLRPGPPYHMTDMIAAEPHLTRRLLGTLLAPDSSAARLATAVVEAARTGAPIMVTGCGTSEHAAIGVADILREALRVAELQTGPVGVFAAQAFEVALDPPGSGLLIAVSHEGGTAATNRALEAGRAAGAATALITVTARSPGAAHADLVVETDELDQGWCHVVGYLSPLLAATAVASSITGDRVDVEAVAELVGAGAKDEAGAEAIASRLGDAGQLLVVASGSDRATGRELVLKVEEASWLPSAFRELETFLHGHVPATDAETGLVLVLTDRVGRDARVARAREALAVARAVGVGATAILSADAAASIPADLTPAGRLVVPEAPELPAAVAAVVGGATPLQLLTERIARARGTNPDPIRRDDPVYREASDLAG